MNIMNGIKISKGKELTRDKNLLFYRRPKFIYIPLISGNDKNITVLVKKGDYVYKGSIVGRRKGNLSLPIFSSVSGTVVDITSKTYLDGDTVKCVVIENDFKEKIETQPQLHEKLNDYTKSEFIKLLKEHGICGMGGSGFPTYIKYDTDKPINTLIVNAVECEPYITADVVLIKEKAEDILETIDAIMDINGIKECFIAFKKDQKLIKLFQDYLGTYPRIKLTIVPNLYPIGWERNLISYVKHVNYNVLPIEKGIVVNNVSTIYAIYEALKLNKPLIERIVTFTGEMLKRPQNVYVKVGTPVKEIIVGLEGYKRNKDVILVAGGPMMGSSLVDDDFVVTPNLNCILILKNNLKEEELNCLRCGRCVKNCPSYLSPVLIKDKINSIDDLKCLHPEKCVECGLCSYVCPSKIKVRKYVQEAKQKVKEVK